MYSIQALWTAAHLKLPITYVIVNNRSYRILKERMVSIRGARTFTGMELREPPIDFKAMAEAMGVRAATVSDPREIDAAMREAVSAGAPRLLEFIVDRGVD
jgi:benzoylformate decarboxylase